MVQSVSSAVMAPMAASAGASAAPTTPKVSGNRPTVVLDRDFADVALVYEPLDALDEIAVTRF
jgi:hypothetical protein